MKKIIVGIIIVIFLSATAGTSYFVYKKEFKQKSDTQITQQEYTQNFQQGQSLFKNGKFSEAVSYLNAASASTKGLDQKGSAELQLAKSYFYLNQPAQAVDILKKIIDDQSYSASYRASSFSVLAAFCGQNLDDNFAKKYIFIGNFQNNLNEENGNNKLAEKNLSEKSLEIYPAEYAYYRLGGWYGENILLAANGKNDMLDNKTKEETLQKIRDYLGKGDNLFAINLQNNYIFKERIAFDYNLRARILGYLLVSGIGDRQTFDDAFTKALDFYDQANVVFTQYNTDLWIRFHWAAFAAEFDGANGQDKIKELITPILNDYASGDPIQDNFFQALGNLDKGDNSNTYSYRESLLIAKYNLDFKNILSKLGWSDDELNKELKPIGAEQK